jgi:hypothetical protein
MKESIQNLRSTPFGQNHAPAFGGSDCLSSRIQSSRPMIARAKCNDVKVQM